MNSLRVLHLTFAPNGGAGQVARTLVDAQRAIGINAQILYQSNGPISDDPLKTPILTGASVLDAFLLSKGSTRQQVSLLRSRVSQRVDINWIRNNFDVVHLHWIEGMIKREDLQEIANAGVKIFWTLHDMRPITGGCHHSEDCEKFETDCVDCPIIRTLFRPAAEKIHHKNSRIQKTLEINYVCPSEWMLHKALNSEISRNAKISFIANPINEIYFQTPRKNLKRTNKFIFISNNLMDPNKRFPQVADWFQGLANKNKFTAVGARPRNSERYSRIQFTGPLETQELIQEIDNSEYLIVNSIAESFSLVIAECASRGVIPIVASGLRNVVNRKLIEAGCQFFEKLDEIPDIISRIEQSQLRETISRELVKCVRSNFSPNLVADNYKAQYQS